MKLGLLSLGCPKNLVDGEVMLGLARDAGHEITPDATSAEVIVVNTCAFIDTAKEESIDAILEMAELKGVPRRAIIFRHALPNALSPIINVVVLNLAYLVVGVIVVEVVFVYPGMGQLMVDGVTKRDVPLVQACGLIFAVTYVGLNLLADILSIVSNPRLRHPR